MFNPIERGRQLREQRQREKKGCGFCGLADKPEESQPYHGVTANPHLAENLRTFADKPADGNTAEKIRNLSAIYPQPTKPATTGFSANPQNPQRGERVENPQAADKSATAADVEAMLVNLRTVGRDLGEVEALARAALLKLSRAAAAELVAVLDDLFETAPGADVARSQCQRVLNDPQALAAAKAVWPDLATLPIEQPDNPAPVIEHPTTWPDYIREHCPLTREDELYLLRCLSHLLAGDAMQAARRYVAAWHQAADAEPTPHRQDNAGRRAANQSLRGNRHAG